MKRSVLVTGASSGIGLATARLLSLSGFEVFAGVRRHSGEPAQEVILDVTNADSIAAARADIESRLNGAGLFAVINNAGVGDMIPLEFTPPERFRQAFEVNVFGVVAVTQAFLPLIHKARGRIVNIGSVGGMVTIPFGSSLSASKHAVEAISDALRLELYAAGIHVTCVQPASINSGVAEKLAAQTEQTVSSLPPEGRRRYGDILRGAAKVMLQSEEGGSPADAVAQVVLEVLNATNPPARRLAGKDSRLMKLIAQGLPDVLRDVLLRKALLGNPKFGSTPAEPS